jgi:hypothetical protein
MTSENYPESGTTNYTYDSISTGNCSGSNIGDKIRRVDAAGNVTCYVWDVLHRLTQVSYPSGPNTTGMSSKYYVYDSAPFWGITVNNGRGRLTEAYTYLGGNTYSADAFSYDARGEVTDYYELAGPGWYHVSQSYFDNGVMASLQGFNGIGTTSSLSDLFSYNLDGEGRPYGMADTTRQETVWSSTAYNVASQPTAVVQSAGGGETFQHDENFGRMIEWQSTAGSNTQTGNLTWMPMGHYGRWRSLTPRIRATLKPAPTAMTIWSGC